LLVVNSALAGCSSTFNKAVDKLFIIFHTNNYTTIMGNHLHSILQSLAIHHVLEEVRFPIEIKK